MRDDYLINALEIIEDRNILINVVSRRVKQLRRGSRPLVESLEKLALEDIALREIAERKISYELAEVVQSDGPNDGSQPNIRSAEPVPVAAAKGTAT